MQNITKNAEHFAARHLGCGVEDITVHSVGGGYSRNRRSIVEGNNKKIFVKEVDIDLLPDEGERELAWLKKDYELAVYLLAKGFDGVSEWAELSDDGKVLLLPCYAPEDGWVWGYPEDEQERREYVDAVVGVTKHLESMQLSDEDIVKYGMRAFFRDELAGDQGLYQIEEDDEMRHQVITKIKTMIESGKHGSSEAALHDVIVLLEHPEGFDELKEAAKRLSSQSSDYFGHCDVRSDNLAYNPTTKQVRLVDWNWASMVPIHFGATEFLIDAKRHGVNVDEWQEYFNRELLAASVGFWLSRCLREPYQPESTLREMQAEAAAMAYSMYRS